MVEEKPAPDEKPADEKPADEKPATEQPSSEDVEKAVEAIYAYAGALLRAGKSPSEVEDALAAKGVSRATAAIVIEKLTAAESATDKADRKNDGTGDMLIGGLIALFGIIVTAVSYSAASEGGGTYVIAWGAIAFGAIRFVKGLSKQGA